MINLATIMLWIFSKWVPKLIFDFKSLIEHFNFGYKLLFSSLINTIYENIYYLIIGKHFSPIQLGFYTRAEQFSNLASTNLTTAVQKVSYSVFSKLQDEPERLKLGYKKLIKSTMFLAFTIIIGLAAIAKPLIYLLLGSKWEQSIVYLQLICLSSMFYPLHALNLNILIFMGRTDLYLKIELIKKVISIPVIIITIFFGIKFMLLGFILLSLIAFYFNSMWSYLLIGYSAKEQILDIFPSFMISSLIGVIFFTVNYYTNWKSLYTLPTELIIGFFSVFSLSIFFKNEGFIEIRNIFTNFISNRISNDNVK